MADKLNEAVSPINAILGEERAEKLKDNIAEIILDRVKDDLKEYDSCIIWGKDIRDIANEVLDEIRPQIKKKIEKGYKRIIDSHLNDLENKGSADD